MKNKEILTEEEIREMKEMKIMDLARLIYQMDEGDVIDFASGDEDTVERWGGWMVVQKFNPFDNDNLIYVIGRYGGEADTYLYHISEYDEHIGDFCERELRDWCNRTDENYINCIAKMLVNFFQRIESTTPEIVTVDIRECGMKKISFAEAVDIFDFGTQQVYCLYDNNTETAVESIDDIMRHRHGEFGVAER